MNEKYENGFCPFLKCRVCGEGCALWSLDHEACALLLIGEGIKEISYAADESNLDCGLRVHVTKFEE